MNDIKVTELEDGKYQFIVTQEQFFVIRNSLDQIEKKREIARNWYHKKQEKLKQEGLLNREAIKYKKAPLQMTIIKSN